jgi:hypothetical protein
MDKTKTYRIIIEVPENWIDADSPIIWASHSIYDEAKSQIKDAVVQQYLSKITLPEMVFTPEELREAVKAKIVSLLAERALEKQGL